MAGTSLWNPLYHCTNLKSRNLIYLISHASDDKFPLSCVVFCGSFEPITCCHTPPVLANCLQLFLRKLLLGKLASQCFNFPGLLNLLFGHVPCDMQPALMQLNFGLPKERPGVLLREWTCQINLSLWVFWCFINPTWISDISGLPLTSSSFSLSLSPIACLLCNNLNKQKMPHACSLY